MDNNQPLYYQENGASPIDCFREGLISREEYIGFCKGNIIKYLVRGGKKNGNSAFQMFHRYLPLKIYEKKQSAIT